MHSVHYSYNQSHSPTDAHNRISNCTCILLPRLTCCCMYSFVFETSWGWRLGVETCKFFITCVHFVILLCVHLLVTVIIDCGCSSVCSWVRYLGTGERKQQLVGQTWRLFAALYKYYWDKKWITTRRKGCGSLSGTEVECIYKFWWGTWKYQKRGRSSLEQEDNTMMNLKEIGW